MSRIARAVVLAPLIVAAAGVAGCNVGPRAHPWKPPGHRPWIDTWTTTYGEFPPSIYDKTQNPPQGQPGDG